MKKCISILAAAVLFLQFFAAGPVNAAATEGSVYEDYFGYSQLDTDAERNVYVKLAEAIDGVESAVYLTPEENITKASLIYIAAVLHNDLPECFYYHSLYAYWDDAGNIESIHLTYNVGDRQVLESGKPILEAKAALEEKVAEIIALVPADVDTDAEKARFVHDYLANNITYKEAASDQNVYGALVDGECVCAGYASAYVLLMRSLGVKAWYIAGTSWNGKRHAWNVAWIDGQCLYTDVCWDDYYSEVSHEYFNVSYGVISQHHTEDEEYVPFLKGLEAQVARVTGVSLSQAAVTLTAEGQTVALTAKVSPENAVNKKVSFTSSDPSVAAVDSAGLITAVGEGTATITAQSADGAAKALCTVTVAYPQPEHQLELVEGKAAGCIEAGWNSYYACKGCGALFADAAGEVPMKDLEEVQIPAKGHEAEIYGTADGHWQKCIDCGDILEMETEHIDVDADGLCDVCDYEMPDVQGEEDPQEDREVAPVGEESSDDSAGDDIELSDNVATDVDGLQHQEGEPAAEDTLIGVEISAFDLLALLGLLISMMMWASNSSTTNNKTLTFSKIAMVVFAGLAVGDLVVKEWLER